MNVIDLFSGVGGFSSGLSKAGYNILLANEIDAQISESYKKNHKKTLMINADITDFIDDFDSLIDSNLKEQKINATKFKKELQNIDLVVGGPPCQGFSMAGGRIRKENEFIDDPRNYLFKQYFKVIQKFEPQNFIFENVVGISSMNGGAILKEIEKLFTTKKNFKKGKYYLQKKVFNANEFGVPQRRKRFILIGSKKPFELETSIKQTYSKFKKFSIDNNIEDAILDLAFENEKQYIDNQEYLIKANSQYQKNLKKGNKTLLNHKIHNHSEKTLNRMSRIKPGENWKNLKEHNTIKSVHSGAYGRMEWNKKAVTITTRFDTPSAGRFIHPKYNRNITAREAARLQSFPDNFIFYGTKTSICKQIGNAVPPLLAEFLGETIKNI